MPISNGKCWLAPFGHKCHGRSTLQHVINKAKFPLKVRKRKPELAEALDTLTVPICIHSNSTTKIADAKWARRVFIERLRIERGDGWVKTQLEKIMGNSKLPSLDLSFDAILSADYPPDFDVEIEIVQQKNVDGVPMIYAAGTCSPPIDGNKLGVWWYVPEQLWRYGNPQEFFMRSGFKRLLEATQ